MKNKINITTTIDESKLKDFFERNDWYYWLDNDEIHHLIVTAVHAAVVIKKGEYVGFLLITGDGRICTELDSLVVNRGERGKGVGRQLLKYSIDVIEKLKPHFFQVKAKHSELEGFYSKFGFIAEKDQVVLSYEPIAKQLNAKS